MVYVVLLGGLTTMNSKRYLRKIPWSGNALLRDEIKRL